MKISRSLLCVIVLLFAHAALAQDDAFLPPLNVPNPSNEEWARSVQPNTYGTATLNRLYVFSTEFLPTSQQTTWSMVSTGIARYGNGPFVAPLKLPVGASVEKIGLRGCDTSNTGAIAVDLLSCNTIGAACDLVANRYTSDAATPGCLEFEWSVSPSVEVSATTNRRLIFFVWGTTNSAATSFEGAFVDYRLRISPAPVSASFTDVPTNHLFFQYIEALKASGITSGCTPTTYCPGQAVTRAEMAAFLARALGLHWAP